MKLAIVSEWVDAWRGGAETSTQQFIHQLMERGVEVHLFTRSRPSPTPHLFVNVVSGAAMGRTRKTVTFMHRVEHMLAEARFDLVHAISPCRTADLYQPRGGTVAESIQRNLAIRGSATSRSLKRYANHFNLKQRYMLAFERSIMRDPNGPIILALSDYVVRQVKSHYGLPDARIRKVFNGIEPETCDDEQRARDRHEVRAEFAIADDTLLAIVIAHNFRLKGVEQWLMTLAALKAGGEKHVRTLIVGKDDSQKWRERARRLGVDDLVIFTGASDRVRRLRHAADTLVHLSFYDPCSRVVLESMACGLPCIATVWDGSSEMIDHGVNGFVLEEPRDLDSVAACVKALLDDKRRREMSEAAKAKTVSFTMDRHTTEILSLYRELVPAEVKC